jgi:hypothetical protein
MILKMVPKGGTNQITKISSFHSQIFQEGTSKNLYLSNLRSKAESEFNSCSLKETQDLREPPIDVLETRPLSKQIAIL